MAGDTMRSCNTVLTPDGSGTRVALDHTGYPADQHDHLSAGWPANYLDARAKYFA
jgi:hypothetical protein